MYFIAFYAPPEHKKNIKRAMFQAGPGRMGHYACCAFETTGMRKAHPYETPAFQVIRLESF